MSDAPYKVGDIILLNCDAADKLYKIIEVGYDEEYVSYFVILNDGKQIYTHLINRKATGIDIARWKIRENQYS